MVRLLLPVALAALASLAQASTSAAPPRLFGDSIAASAGIDALPLGSQAAETIVRSRTVRASPTLIAGVAAEAREGRDARFVLDLFDDAAWVARVVAVDETTQGGVAIDAELEGLPGSHVVLLQNGDRITGSVSHPDGSYSIRTTTTGDHEVTQVDTSKLPEELPVKMRFGARAQRDVVAADVPLDSGRLIDIMVVYTAAARAEAGGTTPIRDRIELGVLEANAAYRNSGIAQRLRLVHMQEVSYVESGDLETDLDRVTDGLVPSVHALRNQHGADLVKMVVAANPNGCGIAWLFLTFAQNNQDIGYSVTTQNCISPNYTFAHELGHNMGAMHEPGNGGAGGVRLYNRGYTPGSGWRDVMTYAGACGSCARLLAFSNPRLPSPRAPFGAMGTTNLHNIAQVLNLTAKAIANYRPTNTTLHPVAQRFSDVPKSHSLYGHIEFMAQAEITSGCVAGAYCPELPVTRRQMAVFLERAIRASNWNPPGATGVFGDVPPASQFASFIEALSTDGVTLGCEAGSFCPDENVTREQMALFVLRARCGAGYAPTPPATATFADVPTSHPNFAAIEKLVTMGITGGCAASPARYCPATPVTRAQMAAFIERAYPFMHGLAPTETCAP